MVFADPTHRRIFALSVILLAVGLILLYLKLFYPFLLKRLRYALLTFSLRTMPGFNRFF